MKEVRHSFESACKKAKLSDFRFHDLRHSAASFMAMSGVDLMAIKQILGHKTIQMTLRYSHLTQGHLRSAVAALGNALNVPSEPVSHFISQSAENAIPAKDPVSVGFQNLSPPLT